MKIKVFCPNGKYPESSLSLKAIEDLYAAAKTERQLAAIGRDVDEVSLTDFVDLVRLSTLFWAGYDEVTGEALGFVYLSHPEGSTARIHFSLFAAGQPLRHCLGRQALDFCFGSGQWTALIGVIPSLFLGAVRFSRELGVVETRIPGACYMARLKRCVDGMQFIFLPNQRGE